MFLDLDPPDDAATGMDAGQRSDGGSAGCTLDEQCDDGEFCNGSEICEGGDCVGGEPLICDDGIDCTQDRCDEGEARCVFTPDDSLCGETPIDCTGLACDPDLGCELTFDDSACDDGIPCTFDACTSEAGCENVPNDGACPGGEFCNPDAGGCIPPPSCEVASDCPLRTCNHSPECLDGGCVYNPNSIDSMCSVIDPCTPATCESGACVIGAPMICATSDLSSCTTSVCTRATRGNVSCGNVDRDGETCIPPEPCTTGTCAGPTCVSSSTCLPSDPCIIASCVGTSTCTRMRVDCGSNAMCVTSPGGGPECVCDPGYNDCIPTAVGCECADTRDGGSGGSCMGAVGWIDCSGDGRCDCNPATSRCTLSGCTCLPCGATECCDPSTATCVPRGGGVCISS